MKRPSFQFYPSDWLRDTALRSCSIGARGLWIDMICYMHEGNPYGYLKVKDKVILPANLARMCGLTTSEVEGWLIELQSSGVCESDEDGAIYSRRMIRDENLRLVRAAGGKLGGNPKLKVNLEDNVEVGNEVKQKPTPSSSSSSSPSVKEKKQRGSRLPADFEMPRDWEEFAEQERPDLGPKKVFDSFKDYWTAKPGSGGVKLDWFATWRNWIRSQAAQKNVSTFSQIKADVAKVTVTENPDFEATKRRVEAEASIQRNGPTLAVLERMAAIRKQSGGSQ